MDTRRDFLKKAALLAAGSVGGALPASIQRAFAIDPPPGSTYLDAEHVVILMQENRSFDHTYGRLRGVRGFNDPRAMTLPDGNPVWLQTNAQGETYAPFRLNLKDTKATWMSALPHAWDDQTAARNEGRHDRWLEAKRSGNKEYAALPLTLGFYERADLPFYYALADAFTVCDQNFCSSLTGTTPNRLYLWSGTIRETPSLQAKANVWNSDVDYAAEAKWTTFPERLEDAGISWRIYQNELSLPSGLAGEADAWLANFTDNPLEWFSQYHVRFSKSFRRHLPVREQRLQKELAELEAKPAAPDPAKLTKLRQELAEVRRCQEVFTEANFAKLSEREQNLHRRAFTTNQGDPDYRELTTQTYDDGSQERRMQVPKGDVLHQFREDVRTGKLPTVSWIVAPERFSDHPGSPWYGAWYLSETLDILTQNPAVWKKTIFILCYDENDGYFDHVPPFVPPAPGRPETGKVSAGIDPAVEHVPTGPGQSPPTHPIGLGYRVPLVVASPWSRGGYVCSQVFDHTSILQLLENVLSHKTGRSLRETNISAWRRTVCGDLSSAFRPYQGEKMDQPQPVERESFLGSIHQAQFRPLPQGYRRLTAPEIALARAGGPPADFLPRQEAGRRPACALPYELTADGAVTADQRAFQIVFAAGKTRFGSRAAGAPFRVFAPGKMRGANGSWESGRNWNYAVQAGDQLSDQFPFADFPDGRYHLQVSGPNGFYREFRGAAIDQPVQLRLPSSGQQKSPSASVRLTNRSAQQVQTVTITDLAYGQSPETVKLNPVETRDVIKDLSRSHGWYDFEVRVAGVVEFVQRYAGHIETGGESFSDPLLA